MNSVFTNSEINSIEEFKTDIIIRYKKSLNDISTTKSYVERCKIILVLFRDINKNKDNFNLLLEYKPFELIALLITIKNKIDELTKQINRGDFQYSVNKRFLSSLLMEFSSTDDLFTSLITKYIKNYGNIKETRDYIYVYANHVKKSYIKKCNKKNGNWTRAQSYYYL